MKKEITGKLKKASRDERKLICKTMQDELFQNVPDHPRVTRRNSIQITAKANKNKLSLIFGLFCEEAECSNLNECTSKEINFFLPELKYSDFQTRWRKKRIRFGMSDNYFLCANNTGHFSKTIYLKDCSSF